MASRIKGITVEIGGDTSGLEKSLAAVNNSIKKTQSQLRDVNNLLKLDPSNTILLAQKQELLQAAIGDTEKRSWKPWNRPRRMLRKPLSGAILEKTSTWLSNVKWRKPVER